MKQSVRQVKDYSSLVQLGASNDPRAPKADITNAAELFGDPFGDIEDGDLEDGDLYGDINDDTLSAFKLISGDIEDGDLYGDPRRRNRNAMLIGGSALAVGGSALLIKRALAKKKARKAALSAQMAKQRTSQTIVTQQEARSMLGKIDKKKKLPFFQLMGAKMNSSPIDPMEGFVADMLKYNLDRQASDTPFYQETAIGTYIGPNWQAVATGAAANRFFTALIVQLGINQLNAAPGTVFQITATVPTINGVLTISSEPWVFTIQKSYDVRFMFFPWQLVSNRPFPVIGQYSNASPITVDVTGLPATNSTVNLIVPGSLHPWTVAMRNSLS